MAKCRLSWDSYQKNISSGLAIFQQHEEFVDMTIATAGYVVKVHKNLFALASPYIKAMIQTVPCQHPVIFLSDINEEILQLILEYVYTGEVIIPIQKMEPFLKACQDLHIIGIENVVPPMLPNDTGGNSSNLIKNENPLTSQMNSGQIGLGNNVNNLLNKQEGIQKRSAISMNKKDVVEHKITRTCDNSINPIDKIDDAVNTESFAKDVDQQNDQSDGATNSETEASVHNLQAIQVRDIAALNVNEELIVPRDHENVRFIEPINVDKFRTLILQNKHFNPKMGETTGEKVLLPTSTEDFEHTLGVHVINTLDHSSNNIQEIQPPEAMAELKIVPTLHLNPSDASNNCFTMNYDKTVHNIEGDDCTDTVTEGYACNNEKADKCMDMEQDVTSKITIQLNNNKNNTHYEGTNMNQCEIREYLVKDFEMTEKIENTLQANTDTEARYNVNVELPGGSKDPPRITIMSGEVQNKPVFLNSNTNVKPKKRILSALDVSDSAVPLYMINGKRRLQLILNRFIYIIHHVAKRRRRWRWRCVDYRHKRCQAYVDTVGDLIVERKNVHIHPFHDKKIVDLGSRRRVFSSLKEIQGQVEGQAGQPLDNLLYIDLGFLNAL